MAYDTNALRLVRHCSTDIGWSDPRSIDGQPCWEDRFPSVEVVKLEKEMGPYAWAGQMQQSPAPRGGGIIKTEWWNDWPAKQTPPLDYIVASLDTAMTEKEESDYSALTIWGSFQSGGTIVGDENMGYDFVAGGVSFDDEETTRQAVTQFSIPKILLINAWRDRLSLPALVERVLATCVKFRVDALLVENKAHGHAVTQTLREMFANTPFSIVMFDPRKYGDKSARLYAVQHLFSEGLIYAPLEKAWADMVVNEVANFPRGAHDDLVDSCAQALHHMRQRGFASRKEDAVTNAVNQLRFRKKSQPLYNA